MSVAKNLIRVTLQKGDVQPADLHRFDLSRVFRHVYGRGGVATVDHLDLAARFADLAQAQTGSETRRRSGAAVAVAAAAGTGPGLRIRAAAELGDDEPALEGQTARQRGVQLSLTMAKSETILVPSELSLVRKKSNQKFNKKIEN